MTKQQKHFLPQANDKFENLKKTLKKHKVFRFLKECISVKNIYDIQKTLWKNLDNSHQFVLIYVKETKSYVAIFKHLYTDVADLEAGKHPFQEKFDQKTESVTEIDFFSSNGVSIEDAEKLRKKDPSVYFGFNLKKWQNKSKILDSENEIIFIILMRLFNYDLHFEEMLHDLNAYNKKDKRAFIK